MLQKLSGREFENRTSGWFPTSGVWDKKNERNSVIAEQGEMGWDGPRTGIGR